MSEPGTKNVDMSSCAYVLMSFFAWPCVMIGGIGLLYRGMVELLFLPLGLAGIWLALRLVRFSPLKTRLAEQFTMAILAWVMTVIIYPVMLGERGPNAQTRCRSNAKQWAISFLIYATDFDDALPVAANWKFQLKGYVRDADEHCPLAMNQSCYAINAAVAGRKVMSSVERTVLVFECASMEASPVGGLQDFVPRHAGTGTIGLLDGGVKLYSAELARSQYWGYQPAPHTKGR